MLSELLTCPDSLPTFLNFFDTSVAPALLFYAYIPIILISLFFGLFVFLKDKKSLQGKLLFLLSSIFSLWILDLTIQWISVYVSYDHFFWQTTPLLEISIPIISIYFVYVFLNKRDLPFGFKILLSIPYVAMCLLLPTNYNVTSFDLMNCEGVFGNFYDYVYTFEIISAFWVGYLCFRKYRETTNTEQKKKEALFLGIGSVFFLMIFAITNLYGELTKLYEVNLIGPIGMVVFLAFLSYLIVRYHTFNIKLIGTQVLVITLVILIASTFFVEDPFSSEIIMVITLLLVMSLGYFLTKSVKREVEQREHIEKLAGDLERANEKLKELDQMKSEFLSLATHQIRAPLTAIKGYSSMLLDGDFGVLPQKATDSIQTILKSCQNLINIVGDFLNISRIEQGRMVYDKTVFEIGELVKESANELKPNVENAGLSMEVEVPENFSAKVNADRSKIKQVIGNIIDNAIKYTVKGSIKVSIFKESAEVKITIKDSGVGIDPSETNKLFSKFSRTKDANKTNVIGTGLGLYIAKKMAEAHHGDIKVHSEGLGLGTTFTIELPLYK
ncbi:MAG: ATP-binding protein [Patescibacteria group bacterium]